MKKSLKTRLLKSQINELAYLVISNHSTVKEKNEVKKMVAYMLKKWKDKHKI